jgi:hypothetical protein
MKHLMDDIEVCVNWKGLDVIVTIEDADIYPPDEFIPTSGYVEIDYVFSEKYPHPMDDVIRMIQAQFDDESDRAFERVCYDCADEIYEKGIEEYTSQQVEYYSAMEAARAEARAEALEERYI